MCVCVWGERERKGGEMASKEKALGGKGREKQREGMREKVRQRERASGGDNHMTCFDLAPLPTYVYPCVHVQCILICVGVYYVDWLCVCDS